MLLRQLGQTGLNVSALGLGTVKLGRNQGVKYPESFVLPSDQDVQRLLGSARDLGINFVDTAPAYGQSEERLGKMLKGQRHDWVIATKAGEEFIDGESSFDFTPAALTHSVERSLQHLKTDYLDVVLVHSNGDDETIIQRYSVFETLERLKQQGKLRAFGMSTKTVAGGALAVQHSDVVMTTYYPGYADELAVIKAAEQANKGVLIKKALASGHLDKIAGDDPVAASMRYIFAEPGVTSVIVGTINPVHLAQNVAKVMQAL